MQDAWHVKMDASKARPALGARSIGDRIAAARLDAGLTQREFSQKLSLSSGAVAQWETGGKKPTVERLAMVAAVLDVSTDWLLGRSKEIGAAPRPEEDLRLLDEACQLGIDLHAVVREARQRR
jgi:transcriptional regulator with XRE-family HTH domain